MFLFQNRQIAINLKDRDMNLYCRIPYEKIASPFMLRVGRRSHSMNWPTVLRSVNWPGLFAVEVQLGK